MFAAVWAFEVEADRVVEFVSAYGPEGDWSVLFASAEGYEGTELLADASRPGRYLTIDRWASEASYDLFMRDRVAEYEAVDVRLEGLATREVPLGTFVTVEGR
ncbi:MAG: antibiotic biosynthesis monooxygenase family protein [Actinomycetota bacterium]